MGYLKKYIIIRKEVHVILSQANQYMFLSDFEHNSICKFIQDKNWR